MHDLRAIREEPDVFDRNWGRRGLEGQTAAILEMDKERRGVQTELQTLQQQRNEKSKDIGTIKAKGGDAQTLMDEVAALKTRMTELEEREKTLGAALDMHLSGLPNLLADDVPDGKDEHGNREERKWGELPRRNDCPDHATIGEKLGMMDFETAAKLSGSRFVLLHSGLARLERALAQFMLDTHTMEHGYTEVSPPLLVNDKTMYGTGQLPKFELDQFECFGELRKKEQEFITQLKIFQNLDVVSRRWQKILENFIDKMHKAKKEGLDVSWSSSVFGEMSKIFHLDAESFKKFQREFDGFKDYFKESESLKGEQEFKENKEKLEKYENEFHLMKERGVERKWLIPTAEVPLTNVVADSIVDEDTLPRRYTAFTPCFRQEAGAAGKDTRGMLRQHQFYKVEMVSIVTPDKSKEEHERMTTCAENILKKLELPFRTMVLCAGDTGFGATKTYDIEVWLPGQNKYREISSCSNCGDFQARRMKARFRRKGEKETQFLHTLNGSGVAVGRALIAVLENYYDPADGSVSIPAVLRPYMGGMEKLAPA